MPDKSTTCPCIIHVIFSRYCVETLDHCNSRQVAEHSTGQVLPQWPSPGWIGWCVTLLKKCQRDDTYVFPAFFSRLIHDLGKNCELARLVLGVEEELFAMQDQEKPFTPICFLFFTKYWSTERTHGVSSCYILFLPLQFQDILHNKMLKDNKMSFQTTR